MLAEGLDFSLGIWIGTFFSQCQDSYPTDHVSICTTPSSGVFFKPPIVQHQKQNVNPNVIFCRSLCVSNYIQLDAIINPWLGQKRLLPCSRWPRSVRGVAAHETTLFPPRTVVVSNYIQLDDIINPWLVQKRLLPCSRLPRAALEV